VHRICPNDAAALRPIGAVWAENHEGWSTSKRYVDRTEYCAWKTTLTLEGPQAIRKVSRTAIERSGKRIDRTF
jgi:hypothetical protein